MRTLLPLALLATGCAGDLRPEEDPPVMTADSHITHADAGTGITRSRIDARDNTAWIYLDLDAKREVAESDATWDLAFRRFNIKLNAGVDAAIDDTKTIESATEASGGPWIGDLPDGDDEDTEPDLAFGGWYDYEVATHTLTAKAQLYFVRSTEHQAFKVKVDGYYDEAGTSGWMTIRWGAVASAAGIVLDGSADWIQLSLAGEIISGDDWDLAVTRTRWRTNSGASGAGLGGARIAAARFDAIRAAPTHGFVTDDAEASNPVLGAWYDYDPATHVVTPKAATYLVRGKHGDYAKLEILGYAEGRTTVRLAPVPRVPEVVELEIDARAPKLVSLRAGGVVDTSTSSLDWDLRLDGVNIGTNSGVSGPGQGGALDPMASALEAVTGAPSGTITADAMLPLPGPPGSGEAPGNAVLGTWYDYNPATHAVSAKAKAFVIRTADGGWAKILITSYASGVYRVKTLYAGAGIDAL